MESKIGTEHLCMSDEKMYIASRCWSLYTIRNFLIDSLKNNKKVFKDNEDLKYSYKIYKANNGTYGDIQDIVRMIRALCFVVKTSKGLEITDPEMPIEELQNNALKRIKGLAYYVELCNKGYGNFSNSNSNAYKLMHDKMAEFPGNSISWDREDLAGNWYAPAFFNTANQLQLIEQPLEKLANYNEEPSIPSSIRLGYGTFGLSSGSVRTSFGTKSENIARNYMSLDELNHAKWKDRQAIVDIVSQIINIDGKEYIPVVEYVPVDYFWEEYVKKVRKKQR